MSQKKLPGREDRQPIATQVLPPGYAPKGELLVGTRGAYSYPIELRLVDPTWARSTGSSSLACVHQVTLDTVLRLQPVPIKKHHPLRVSANTHTTPSAEKVPVPRNGMTFPDVGI